jgi:integrase
MTSLPDTSSNDRVNLLSRSWIRNRTRSKTPVKLRLRACWVTQAPVGFVVQHAFRSLLIAEGLSVVEIAQQAGHSPAMMLATYAHVIEELAGTERRPAEAVIRDARDKLVSEMCPPVTRQRRH